MKILICKSHFAGPVSGADETLVAYATRLARLGHDVSVAVLFARDGCADLYTARLTQAGISVTTIAQFDPIGSLLRRVRRQTASLIRRVVALPPPSAPVRVSHWLSYRMCSLVYASRCRAYFKGQDFQVVHALTPDSGVAVMIRAAADAGVPVVYQELGEPRHQPRSFTRVLPFCNEIVVLAPTLARQWRDVFHMSIPAVVPLVVDDSGTADPAEATPARRTGTTFGFAARLDPSKGPFTLLEAFAAVHAANPAARLVVAGDGKSREALLATARALGIFDACSFPGPYQGREGRAAFMRAIDVFVLPSLGEGTPNSIIEAMAHGLPVIASKVGGIPDLVSEETGRLVPPNDAAALADAMTTLAARPDDRARLGLAARARFEQLFAPDTVLSALVDAYQRAIAQPLGAADRTTAQFALPRTALERLPED